VAIGVVEISVVRRSSIPILGRYSGWAFCSLAASGSDSGIPCVGIRRLIQAVGGSQQPTPQLTKEVNDMSEPTVGKPLPTPVNDVGGLPAGPMIIADHELAPWEKRCHATLECLNWRGVMSQEEKRRAIEDLGETINVGHSYYEKWALAAAMRLMDKGLITQDELANKMDEIRARGAASG
jgi:Nitrile hydratase beta subunit